MIKWRYLEALHPLKHNGWGTNRRSSIFSYRPREFDPQKNYYTKILLTTYCKEKPISRKQAETLAKKNWLGVTRVFGRIWVHEICPDEINDYLGI